MDPILPLGSLASRIPLRVDPEELDSIDVRLLVELARNARIPQRQLADVLGMSSPAVADRIAKLKSRGIIRGFSVDIDWDALGYTTVAFISVVAAVGQEQEEVIRQLERIRGVEEITVVTGGTDMIVKLRTRGFDDLRTILAGELWSVEGIQRTDTSIALIRVVPEDVSVRLLESMPKRAGRSETGDSGGAA